MGILLCSHYARPYTKFLTVPLREKWTLAAKNLADPVSRSLFDIAVTEPAGKSEYQLTVSHRAPEVKTGPFNLIFERHPNPERKYQFLTVRHEEFLAACEGTVQPSELQAVEKRYLSEVGKKKAARLTVGFRDTEMALTHGDGTDQCVWQSTSVDEQLELDFEVSDLLLLTRQLGKLRIVGGLTFAFDTKGMLRVKGATQSLDFTVYVPALSPIKAEGYATDLFTSFSPAAAVANTTP